MSPRRIPASARTCGARAATLLCSLLALLLMGPDRLGRAAPCPEVPQSATVEPRRLGELSRRELLRISPSWSRPDRLPDPELVRRLSELEEDWSLEVAYGHWCSDSAREIPRLLALLEGLGKRAPQVRWYAVDRGKRNPPELVRRLDIEQVPTLVVKRRGRELGRIVERADPSVESRLLEILERPNQTVPARPDLSSCRLYPGRRVR